MKATKKKLYQDSSYTVESVELSLDNGSVCKFPLINHPGGVVILAVNDKNEIALVRQNRFAIGEETLELPAGKLDNTPNETPLDGAKRELREEVGVLANTWTFLGHVYPSPGILSEKLYLYLAKDLTLSEQDLDFDEILTAEWMSLPDFQALLLALKITDAKTLCAYMLAKERKLL